VIINYTKERRKVIFKNDKRNIEKLKQYPFKNELELKNLNDKYFNIIKYFKN